MNLDGNTRQEMKRKLSTLLLQVKNIKKQLSTLQQLHKQFTFTSLLPKITSIIVPAQKPRPCSLNQQNKQNSLNALNRAPKATRNDIKQVRQTKQAFRSFPKDTEIVTEGEELKNKNSQIKDLKATLILQLSQIKSMEKKSESMRRTNQKIKEYNSYQKRNYRESVSKDKENESINLSNISHISQKSRTAAICDKSIESFINDSKISLAPPIPDQPKTLKCQKGHQFYQGLTNPQGQPHGNGRLEICCNAIPLELGHNLKDFIFYQGQFKDGKFHGFGTLSYRGGVKYVGEFREGVRHGKGSMYCGGKAEVANWQNDTFISIM